MFTSMAYPSRAACGLASSAPDSATVYLPNAGLIYDNPRLATAVPKRSLMIVDDDTLLLSAMTSTLRVVGFDVVACDDPNVAVSILQREGSIQMLLTDLQMPHLTGVELAAICSRLRPALPVLIQSGAEPTPVEWEVITRHGWDFRAKPVSVAELVATVSRKIG